MCESKAQGHGEVEARSGQAAFDGPAVAANNKRQSVIARRALTAAASAGPLRSSSVRL